MEKRLVLLDGQYMFWAECHYNTYWGVWECCLNGNWFLEGRFDFLNAAHMENVSRCS